jgi:hypothetical protein
MLQNISIILKNGYYIPFLFPLLYSLTNNVLLSTTITLKMFPANYMFWYSHKFDYGFVDYRYNQIKQIVRFTDTGYLASILVLSSSSYVSLAFNIHFAITFGYWIAKYVLGIDDVDKTNGSEYDVVFERFWVGLVHGVPLTILTYYLVFENTREDTMCPYYFSPRDLMMSYVWLWTWIFAVYIPWRIRTGDPVYDFMDTKIPIVFKIAGVVLMHGLLGISNVVGRYIHVVVANRY